MRTRLETAIGVAAVALILCALPIGVDEASAAVPVACVRNLTDAEIDMALGAPPEEGQSNGWGQDWGKLAARGGKCQWTDMGFLDYFFFRRAGSFPPLNNGEAPTRAAGWKECPRHTSYPTSNHGADFVFTIRRGLFGITCKIGGDTEGLEGPGDYDLDPLGDE